MDVFNGIFRRQKVNVSGTITEVTGSTLDSRTGPHVYSHRNYKLLTLTSAAPAPSGTDILDETSSPIVSGDLAIRDTAVHLFAIPLAARGWRDLVIGIDAATAFDQGLSVILYGAFGLTRHSLIGSFAITQGIIHKVVVGSGGAVGVGGIAGASSTADAAYYSIPAMSAGWPFVLARISATSAPTVGSLILSLARTS